MVKATVRRCWTCKKIYATQCRCPHPTLTYEGKAD